MTQQDREAIYACTVGHLPPDIISIVVLELKTKEKSYSHLLIGEGQKFKNEVTIILTERQFDALKDYLSSSDNPAVYKASMTHLNSIYRKIICDQMIRVI